MIPLSIYVKKVKIADYHHGQLFWPVSQIRLQRNMLGFLVEGHILVKIIVTWLPVFILSAHETQEREQNQGKQCSDSSLASSKTLGRLISLNRNIIRCLSFLYHISHSKSVEKIFSIFF